ncbi:MAG: DnaJ domain-containing protein [Planctomycetota bacterium]|nr:DnaJ domain-containing protein [Planctomycetota bacterium]
MRSNVVNYYDILEVHQEVSIKEIQRSFRMLIKKYHPDINTSNKVWAESKTKTIIQAYKTLSDSTTREQYDRLYKIHFRTPPRPNKNKQASTETEDIQARVRIILFDLLNGHTPEAINNYELLRKDYSDVNFLVHLNHRDYIDCKFLLAESYEKLGRCEIAVELYEFILERGKNTFQRRHLIDEIKERISNIYCRKLARYASPQKALSYYEKVLQLKLYKNKNAFIYKKMAERYLELREYENALRYLNIALSLNPNLQGIQKLRTKLKQHTAHCAA